MSGSTCLLAGYPKVVASEPGSPAVTATNGSYFPEGHPADMSPAGISLLGLVTDRYCRARPDGGGGGPSYHHLAITLPGGDTVLLTTGSADGLDLTCGLHLSRFVDPAYPQREPVYPLDVLKPALQLPETAHAGAALDYIVTLRNPTRHTIDLKPCPGYVEDASAVTPTKESYSLNCRPIPKIAAGQTIRFAMRMHLPPDVAAGPLDIAWSLDQPDVFAAGHVNIVT